MSTSVGTISLDMVLNSSRFHRQLGNIQNQANVTGQKMAASFKKVGAAVAAAFSTAMIAKFGKECVNLANIQTEAETKLTTIMKQRMQAADKSIQKIKDYASAQQQLGVVRELAFSAFDRFCIEKGINIPVKNFSGFNNGKILTGKMTYDLVKSVIRDDEVVSEILKAYCELNACFGLIDSEGALKFITLYKQQSNQTAKKDVDETISEYTDLEFEEYVTRPINRIRFSENKNGHSDYGFSTDRQSWYISDNIITKSCINASELVTAFKPGNSKNNYIFYDLYSYRPFSADVLSRWWLEPGDKVRIKTGYNDTEYVESFVFERTIKGINGMKVTIKSHGEEFLGKDEISNE